MEAAKLERLNDALARLITRENEASSAMQNRLATGG